VLVKVRKYLTNSEYTKNPLPFRTMRIKEIKRETEKAVLVSLLASPVPQSECIHCGKEIKHPQSLYFGIGTTCIKYFPELLDLVNYEDIETTYKQLQEAMQHITWEGWLPRSATQFISEGSAMEIIFMFQGKQYKVVTQNPEKIDEIREKADQILSENEVEM
jgi:hypothetical protein